MKVYYLVFCFVFGLLSGYAIHSLMTEEHDANQIELRKMWEHQKQF